MFNAMKPYLVLDEAMTLDSGTSPYGQSVVLPDVQELENVTAAFREGALHEYAAGRAPGSEPP